MHLGKSFGQYIDPVANLLATKVIHEKSSNAVKKEATKTLSILIGCCDNQQKMLELLHMFLPEIAKEIAVALQREGYMHIKWQT